MHVARLKQGAATMPYEGKHLNSSFCPMTQEEGYISALWNV